MTVGFETNDAAVLSSSSSSEIVRTGATTLLVDTMGGFGSWNFCLEVFGSFSFRTSEGACAVPCRSASNCCFSSFRRASSLLMPSSRAVWCGIFGKSTHHELHIRPYSSALTDSLRSTSDSWMKFMCVRLASSVIIESFNSWTCGNSNVSTSVASRSSPFEALLLPIPLPAGCSLLPPNEDLREPGLLEIESRYSVAALLSRTLSLDITVSAADVSACVTSSRCEVALFSCRRREHKST